MAREKLERLVDDLVRLGDYNKWEEPKQAENVAWFSKNGNGYLSYQKDEFVIARLKELVEEGADLTSKAYLFANVNSPGLLKAALELGADPNIPGKAGILAVERSFYKGRSSLVEVLIDDPKFDLNQRGRKNENILFMALSTGKYKIANNIFVKKPELALEKDANNSTVMICLAEYLTNGKRMNSKVIKFVNSFMDYILEIGHDFSATEVNSKNKSVTSLFPELAEIITEKQALDLEKKLSKKEDETKKTKFKI